MPATPIVHELASVFTTTRQDGPISLREFEKWLVCLAEATNKQGLKANAEVYANYIIERNEWGTVHDIATMTIGDMKGCDISFGHAQLIFANLQGGQEPRSQSPPRTPRTSRSPSASPSTSPTYLHLLSAVEGWDMDGESAPRGTSRESATALNAADASAELAAAVAASFRFFQERAQLLLGHLEVIRNENRKKKWHEHCEQRCMPSWCRSQGLVRAERLPRWTV